MNNFKNAEERFLVSVYVPTVTKNGDVIRTRDHDDWVEIISTRLAAFYGGVTSYRAAGGWVDDFGSLVKEEVTVVNSYATFDCFNSEIVQEKLLALCDVMRSSLNQTEIALFVNGKYLGVREH